MAQVFLLVLGCFLLAANLIFMSVWLLTTASKWDEGSRNCADDLERVIDIRQITISCFVTDCFEAEPNATVGAPLVSWFDGFIPNEYNKYLSPAANNTPVDAKVSAYVLSLSEFDEINSAVDVVMYMRQHWTDHRLNSKFTKANGSVSSRIGHEMVWIPDLFVQNAVLVRKPDGPNAFLKVEPDGSITYSQKVNVRVPCVTEYHHFPFDTLRCGVVFESFALTTGEFSLSWLSKPGYSDHIEEKTLLPLRLLNFIHENRSFISEGGRYDQVSMEFIFARAIGSYFKSGILPAIGFVAVGYVTFFLSLKDVTSRIELCSMVILASALVSINLRSQLPRTSFAAIDIWSLVTSGFISLSIWESALVHNLHANKSERRHVPDRICRVLYPVCLVIVGAVLYGVYT